jgi:hypothetical protein
MTAQRRAHCGGGWSAYPAPTRTTRDTVGCGIAGTDTDPTICLGFTGPKAEAEGTKRCLAESLRDELKLEFSQDKRLITHARRHGPVPRL